MSTNHRLGLPCESRGLEVSETNEKQVVERRKSTYCLERKTTKKKDVTDLPTESKVHWFVSNFPEKGYGMLFHGHLLNYQFCTHGM